MEVVSRYMNIHSGESNEIVNLHDPKNEACIVFDSLDVSETTRVDYKYRIGLFIDFVGINGLNRDSFLAFKRWLSVRTDIGVATKNKYLACARIFLKELNRRGSLQMDITQNVKAFGQSKKHKRDGLDEVEISLLAEKIRSLEQTPTTLRLKAILALLALQGLRQIEVTRLDVSDLDLVAGTAMIRGKGQDDKEPIYLHPATAEAVKEYMKACKVADGALFVSRSNNSRNKRLTTRALRGLVGDVLQDIGINKCLHGFRHYFTTTLIKSYKGDLLEVARYTRHKTIEMLMVYNDSINQKADLPRYYQAFESVKF